MIHWDPEFCRMIAARGFRVIRFDNRDVGHSSKLGHAPVPKPSDFLLGRPFTAPYALEDMARDVVGLLDNLGIEAAHVVGASMGGAIAQTIAIRHPDRVRSLCSIMATTGDPDLSRS